LLFNAGEVVDIFLLKIPAKIFLFGKCGYDEDQPENWRRSVCFFRIRLGVFNPEIISSNILMMPGF